MNTKNKVNKILGCLYGQAVGDAMGMPSELWTQNRVRHYFGFIETFLPGPKENIAASTFSAGEYTDDTQQAVALIHSIIESNGKIIPQNIAKHILIWADEKKAFEFNILGPTSKAALLAIKAGEPIEKISANGVTNGSAMRVSPLGCLLTTGDREKFIQSVAAACSVTHKSDIAIAGAGVVAWAISRAIDGIDWTEIKSELPQLAQEIQTRFESTFSPSLAKRIAMAFDFAQTLKSKQTDEILTELYQVIGAGMDIIETIPTALAMVEISDQDPMRCAVLCANLGGDTDTIGAIATAICGAISDINAFPLDAINTINRANHIDFKPLSETLAQLRIAKG